MAIDYQVPFFANTSDDTHCFQAALKMVLKYVYPERNYSWEELDSLSAKVKDLWTWPTAALFWLKQEGLAVEIVSPFDYSSFIQEGGQFLIRKYGKEVGDAQIHHSDINQEQILANQLLRSVQIDNRIPDVGEIVDYLGEGYLVISNVNSKLLNGKEGYEGHFVVIKGCTNTDITFHDPGLPPIENRKVTLEEFVKAWSFPNDEARSIYAIKRS